jgi:SPX domain protein involved in polyphosphate accumulation
MKITSQREIPPELERFELKYHVPMEMVGKIVDFIAPYCFKDKYSEMADDGFYRINNLYFDSPFFTFLNRKIQNTNPRFNMRIRCYGEAGEPPYFCEIKHKIGDVVRKVRARVNSIAWVPRLAGADCKIDVITEKERRNLMLFQKNLLVYCAEPKAITQYSRMAFISHVDDYARVTFDIGLRCMEQSDYELTPLDERMIPYDFETLYEKECNVILELKCYTSQVPLWMLDLISYFNLERRGFSKYASAMLKLKEGFWIPSGVNAGII